MVISDNRTRSPSYNNFFSPARLIELHKYGLKFLKMYSTNLLKTIGLKLHPCFRSSVKERAYNAYQCYMYIRLNNSCTLCATNPVE